MHNCIFTPHCTELLCDKSCPKFVETSYLLERNGIPMNSPVFNKPPEVIAKVTDMLNTVNGRLRTITDRNTVSCAEVITYCAICQNWQGSRLHCNVYNLRYSKYLEETKKSWTTRTEPESLEYMRIWANSAKVLIISNLDFVNFKDFESQTLLNLIQSRENTGQTTIVVTPGVNNLIGEGKFFTRLLTVLGEGVDKN